MFSVISKGGLGTLVLLLETGLRFFNIEAPAGSVASAVNGIAIAISLLLLVWHQLERSDLVMGLVRK